MKRFLLFLSSLILTSIISAQEPYEYPLMSGTTMTKIINGDVKIKPINISTSSAPIIIRSTGTIECKVIKIDGVTPDKIKVSSSAYSDTSGNALALNGESAFNFADKTEVGFSTMTLYNYCISLGISTSTINNDLQSSKVSIGVSTGSIITTLQSVNISTAALQIALTLETTNRQYVDILISGSTQQLRLDLTAETTNRQYVNILISGVTQQLRIDLTSETTNRQNIDNLLSGATQQLRLDLTAETTNRQNIDNLLSGATQQLRLDLTAETTNRVTLGSNIGISTGSINIDLQNFKSSVASSTPTVNNSILFNGHHETEFGALITSNTWAFNNYFMQNLGVGTTNPTQILDVVGTGRFSAGIMFGDNSIQLHAIDYSIVLSTSDAANTYLSKSSASATYQYVGHSSNQPQVDSLVVSTSSLQNQINSLGISTGNITIQIINLGISSGTIKTQIDNVQHSTYTQESILLSTSQVRNYGNGFINTTTTGPFTGSNVVFNNSLTASNTIYAHTGNFTEVFVSTIIGKSPVNFLSPIKVNGNIIISTDTSGGTASLTFPDGSVMTSANTGIASSLSNNGNATITSDASALGTGDIIFKTGQTEGFRVANGGHVQVPSLYFPNNIILISNVSGPISTSTVAQLNTEDYDTSKNMENYRMRQPIIPTTTIGCTAIHIELYNDYFTTNTFTLALCNSNMAVLVSSNVPLIDTYSLGHPPSLYEITFATITLTANATYYIVTSSGSGKTPDAYDYQVWFGTTTNYNGTSWSFDNYTNVWVDEPGAALFWLTEYTLVLTPKLEINSAISPTSIYFPDGTSQNTSAATASTDGPCRISTGIINQDLQSFKSAVAASTPTANNSLLLNGTSNYQLTLTLGTTYQVKVSSSLNSDNLNGHTGAYYVAVATGLSGVDTSKAYTWSNQHVWNNYPLDATGITTSDRNMSFINGNSNYPGSIILFNNSPYDETGLIEFCYGGSNTISLDWDGLNWNFYTPTNFEDSVLFTDNVDMNSPLTVHSSGTFEGAIKTDDKYVFSDLSELTSAKDIASKTNVGISTGSTRAIVDALVISSHTQEGLIYALGVTSAADHQSIAVLQNGVTDYITSTSSPTITGTWTYKSTTTFQNTVGINELNPQLIFNETNSNESMTLNKSSTSSQMTLTNQLYEPTGVGNCLLFNGASHEYVEVSSAAYLTSYSSFTISVWMNLTNSAHDWESVLAKGTLGVGDYCIAYSPTQSSLRFYVNGSNMGSTSVVITAAAWHNIIMRRSGSNVNYILDNVVLSTYTYATNITNAGYSLRMGDDSLKTYDYYGKLDEVAIWNRDLSLAEINELYNGGSGNYILPASNFNSSGLSKSLNLELLYHLDETSGTGAYDSSVNASTGTLMNMAGTEWTAGIIPSTITTLMTTNILKSYDGMGVAEQGINVLGCGYGTNIYDATNNKFTAAGMQIANITNTGLLLDSNISVIGTGSFMGTNNLASAVIGTSSFTATSTIISTGSAAPTMIVNTSGVLLDSLNPDTVYNQDLIIGRPSNNFTTSQTGTWNHSRVVISAPGHGAHTETDGTYAGAMLYVYSTSRTSLQSNGGSIAFGGMTNTGTQSDVCFASIEGIKDNALFADSSGDLLFRTQGSGGMTEKMRITYDAKVGIGITNPAVKLDVNGAINTSSNFTAAGTVSDYAQLLSTTQTSYVYGVTTPTVEGVQFYNPTLHQIMYSTGTITAWDYNLYTPICVDSETVGAPSIAQTTYIGIATCTVVLRGGRPLKFDTCMTLQNGAGSSKVYTVALVRDGNLIHEHTVSDGGNSDIPVSPFHFEQSSISGTHYYSLWIKSSSATGTQTIQDIHCLVTEY